MPASSFDIYLQDARNNFDAVRPAPIPTDANVFMGQCQNLNNIHVSTNCYYGFHDPKSTRNQLISIDCEMLDAADTNGKASPQIAAKKRSADNADFPQSKRLRQEEVQKEKAIEPETKETLTLDTSNEDLLQMMYWNTHGGNIFHLIQCL